MKLFYCTGCGIVRVFNVYDINKHDLKRPADHTCPACRSVGFEELDELDRLPQVS